MTKKEKLIKGNMCNSAIYGAGFQKGKLEQKKEGLELNNSPKDKCWEKVEFGDVGKARTKSHVVHSHAEKVEVYSPLKSPNSIFDNSIIDECGKSYDLGFQKGKLEERKRILKEIDKTITFVDVRRASSLIGLEIIKCLKQLQKEIGEGEDDN